MILTTDSDLSLPILKDHSRRKVAQQTKLKICYQQEPALIIREVTQKSIGSKTSAKALELKHTIVLIQLLNNVAISHVVKKGYG